MDSDSTFDHDAALLRRITEGDREAVGELYDRHAGALFGLLLHILRDGTEAEHVLQDVFIQIGEQRDSYHRSLGSVAAWLIGQARFRAIERLQSKPYRVRTRQGLDGASLQPGVRFGRGREQHMAALALSGLPAEQRQLIEQAFYLGFDHHQLAARHRLPIGIVESHLQMGMRELLNQVPLTTREEPV